MAQESLSDNLASQHVPMRSSFILTNSLQKNKLFYIVLINGYIETGKL